MGYSLVELESIVRNRICNVCTERNVDGQCGLEEPTNCALFRLFPQVAQAIQSVESDDIQQYIDAIRRNVCAVCADRASDDSCETRQQVRCALDAYLLLVVDAIEEATGRTFNKQGLSVAGPGSIGRSAPPIQL
ncbi:MAG: hypothetical protein ABSF54_24115 [Bryobacteraceae bacterium]|jgi:hypothetical protein